MDPRNATSATPCSDAIEFVRFCYRRRRVGWPELYDEMCAVAGRGLFRGYDADDLAGIGIGFSLFDMPALSVLAGRIVAEEQALRRPVAVLITAAEPVQEVDAPTPASAIRATPEVALSPAQTSDERTFDVPIRLVLVPTGA
jgi:hypothetical protein